MVRIGQLGVGYWGKNLLRNFASLPDCDVRWVCEPDETARERAAALAPNARFTTREADLWDDTDLDAVVIATPAVSHAQIAQRAFDAGKHVFIEKPMSMKVDDAESLVDASKRAEKILMVGHLLEYHPAYVRTKELIDEGELGDIYYLYSTRVNLGRVRDDENAMWSLAPHDISLALMMIEADPVSVSVTGQAYLRPDVEDVAFMNLRFSNGVIASIHVSWLDPHKVRKLTIVGSKKMIVVDDMEPAEKVRVYDMGVNWTGQYQSYGEALSLRVGDISIPHITMTEPLKIECQAFIDAIKSGRPPRSDGIDGLNVVRVLAAGERSLREGGAPIAI